MDLGWYTKYPMGFLSKRHTQVVIFTTQHSRCTTTRDRSKCKIWETWIYIIEKGEVWSGGWTEKGNKSTYQKAENTRATI